MTVTTPAPKPSTSSESTTCPSRYFLNEDPVVYNHSYFAEFVALGNYVHSHTLTTQQAHEICGTHPDLTQFDPIIDILNQRYGDTGRVGSLLGAPYGASDDATAAAARRCGLDTIVHWTATAENGQVTHAAGTVLQPGDIMLTLR
ncbi:hypothetical protein [Jiangella gansuensis]|uniref:hypothetical protein n=1 Tax=Jiangella gansuensis TaxID=281473 RepID=UPI0004B1BC6D|nr:hypothetical protein [Jiangella gansuensis]